MNAELDPEQSRRQARRAFIRTHHPDAGGDAAGFVSGLAELEAGADAQQNPSAPEPPAAAASDQPWPVSITTSLLRRARRRKRPPPGR